MRSLKLYDKLFAYNFNVFDSLGEAYLISEDYDLALENYKPGDKVDLSILRDKEEMVVKLRLDEER